MALLGDPLLTINLEFGSDEEENNKNDKKDDESIVWMHNFLITGILGLTLFGLIIISNKKKNLIQE